MCLWFLVLHSLYLLSQQSSMQQVQICMTSEPWRTWEAQAVNSPLSPIHNTACIHFFGSCVFPVLSVDNYVSKYVKSCNILIFTFFTKRTAQFFKCTFKSCRSSIYLACFFPECGNGECLTATLGSFVNHRFWMIHRSHTSPLQLWGWKWWSAQIITLSTTCTDTKDTVRGSLEQLTHSRSFEWQILLLSLVI